MQKLIHFLQRTFEDDGTGSLGGNVTDLAKRDADSGRS
jgi:hypothetical protein